MLSDREIPTIHDFRLYSRHGEACSHLSRSYQYIVQRRERCRLCPAALGWVNTLNDCHITQADNRPSTALHPEADSGRCIKHKQHSSFRRIQADKIRRKNFGESRRMLIHWNRTTVGRNCHFATRNQRDGKGSLICVQTPSSCTFSGTATQTYSTLRRAALLRRQVQEQRALPSRHRKRKNDLGGGGGGGRAYLAHDELDVLGLHPRLVHQLVRVNVRTRRDGRDGRCRRRGRLLLQEFGLSKKK